jgi:ABC-type polysaccharide/polyol phosphate transport system ATPase subunit
MTDIAISARGLTKRYRGAGPWQHGDRPAAPLRNSHRGSEEFQALDDVSFDVRHGEIAGIVGGNGAGKSTLFKILSGVVRPSAGTAELHGRLAPLLEAGAGFHPELTGRENIYMCGISLGMPRAEVAHRFDEIVAFAGVERFLDTPLKWYASSMKTRLGFAVATHLPAEILLIDEVLAVGDPAFQARCLARMREVAAEGRTVLFISHDLDWIRTLCSRAIWLDRGRIRADSANVRTVTNGYLAAGAAAVPVADRPGSHRAFPRVPERAGAEPETNPGTETNVEDRQSMCMYIGNVASGLRAIMLRSLARLPFVGPSSESSSSESSSSKTPRQTVSLMRLPRLLAEWRRSPEPGQRPADHADARGPGQNEPGQNQQGQSQPVPSRPAKSRSRASRLGEAPLDPHRFYPAGWFGRLLAKSRPSFHADIGSRPAEVALLSALVPVTIFVDPRPLHAHLPGLMPVAGDITQVPLPDKSMVSLSSLDVIGQGGDDPERDRKALDELQRVLGYRGSLYLSVPVGRERVHKGQRIFAPQTIVAAVPALRLRRFSFSGDDRVFHVAAALEQAAKLEYGCGLFEFERS